MREARIVVGVMNCCDALLMLGEGFFVEGKSWCLYGCRSTIPWRLIENELADVAAKRAKNGNQVGCASLFKSVQCLWKRRQRM